MTDRKMSSRGAKNVVVSAEASMLGHLALVPFVFGAATVLLARPSWQPMAGAALSAFAATVVSFLGAIHWGFGMRQSRPAALLFLWGIVPSLGAWAALLLPAGAALVLHSAMLLWCYIIDRAVYPTQGAAGWLPMRRRLTMISVLSCLAAAFSLLVAG
jgi:putative flippase GtrA